MGAYYGSKPPATSPVKLWLIAVGGLIVVGAAAWGISAGSRADANGVAVPDEFTVEAMRQRVADRETPGFRRMRDTMARDDLTVEQKRKIAENMREVFQAEMRARVNEYFNAPPEQQNEILDRHIDEWQEMRERFRREREQRDRSEEDRPTEEERERMREIMRPQSKQERKVRSESRNPDETARAMAYFGAMRSRAEARGIEMPRGPGPGGRGGGSRGGPGGGRRGRP